MLAHFFIKIRSPQNQAMIMKKFYSWGKDKWNFCLFLTFRFALHRLVFHILYFVTKQPFFIHFICTTSTRSFLLWLMKYWTQSLNIYAMNHSLKLKDFCWRTLQECEASILAFCHSCLLCEAAKSWVFEFSENLPVTAFFVRNKQWSYLSGNYFTKGSATESPKDFLLLPFNYYYFSDATVKSLAHWNA